VPDRGVQLTEALLLFEESILGDAHGSRSGLSFGGTQPEKGVECSHAWDSVPAAAI
jgi:hypothetical protein